MRDDGEQAQIRGGLAYLRTTHIQPLFMTHPTLPVLMPLKDLGLVTWLSPQEGSVFHRFDSRGSV